MEELERPAPRRRRRRRRSVQIIHRIKAFVPIALVALAMMLSAGVIRVMEVGRTPVVERKDGVVSELMYLERATIVEALRVEENLDAPNLLAFPSAPPRIEDLLSVSVLDEQPESTLPAEPAPGIDELLDGLTPLEPLIPDFSLVPEPSTLFLVGGGLVGLASAGRSA